MPTYKIDTIDTIADLLTYTVTTGVGTTVVVQDTNTGGTFIYYKPTGSPPPPLPAADYITIYPATGSGVWKRLYNEAEAINVLWATDTSGNPLVQGNAFANIIATMVPGSTTLSPAPIPGTSGPILYYPFPFVSNAIDSGKTILISSGHYDALTNNYSDLITTIVSSSPTSVTIATAPAIFTLYANVVNAGAPLNLPPLTANMYNYVVVALDVTKMEILAYSTISVNVTGSNNVVQLNWGAVSGAYVYLIFQSTGTSTPSKYNVLYNAFPLVNKAQSSYYDTGTSTYPNTETLPASGTPIYITTSFGNDDTAGIQKVLNLPFNVLFPSAFTFLITYGLFPGGVVAGFTAPPYYPTTTYQNYPTQLGIGNRTIFAYGATIVNANLTHIFWAQSANNLALNTQTINNITIKGGLYLCPSALQNITNIYTDQSAVKFGNQNCFTFKYCLNIIVSDVHIIGSDECGITNTQCVNIILSGNTIENTNRDGIYTDFSCFIRYVNNVLRNIKDDAMSMHDYGQPANRAFMLNNTPNTIIVQGGESIVCGNIVENAVEGFASFGCSGISIYGNEFTNTVNCAIQIFNTTLDTDSTNYLNLNKIDINNNVCRNNCNTVTIMNSSITNGAPTTGAIAAIVVASYGSDGGSPAYYTYPYASASAISSGVNIENNKIHDCGTNAVFAHQVTGLTMSNNYAHNCNGLNIMGSTGAGCTYLTFNCNFASILHNVAIDDRATPYQRKGYSINNTSGSMDFWLITGLINNGCTDVSQGEITGTASGAYTPVNMLINTYTAGNFQKTVKAATTVPVTLAGNPGYVDGYNTWNNRDLILVKNQSSSSDNGIYSINTATSAPWQRLSGADSINELVSLQIYVQFGTTLGGTVWVAVPGPSGNFFTFSQTYYGLASAGNSGFLSSSDWMNFNSKYPGTGNPSNFLVNPVPTSTPLKLTTPIAVANNNTGLFINTSGSLGTVASGPTALVFYSFDLNNANALAGTHTLFTSPTTASLSSYVIYLYVKALTGMTGTNTLQLKVVFTDETGAGTTVTTLAFNTSGTGSPTISAAGNYVFPPLLIRANSGSTISIQTIVPTGGSTITFDVSSRVVLT